jgi:DNA polymerase-3 subunit gamma/tau
LFSGPRGTGKTTTARLLAKAVNCLDDDPARRPCNTCTNCLAINAGASPDIIEIDAASNRGIDDIRDLRERVRYAPAQLRSKVYIIDEAHQITGAAANAFLKTLEEPPAHSRFILATTDPEELLPTIVSRCQRFEFRRVSLDSMVRRLRSVADHEGITIDDDALRAIANHATGSLRDALGLLEQLSLLGGPERMAAESAGITVADVLALLGLSRNDRIEQLVAAIAARRAGDALRGVQDAVDAGEDARQLNRQLVNYLRLLLRQRSGAAVEVDERARSLAASFSLADLTTLTRRFSEIDFSIKHSPLPQLPLEIALVEAATSPEALAQPTAPAVEHVSDERTPVSTPRPVNLRDRIRGTTTGREAPERELPKPERPSPLPITQLRPVPADPVAVAETPSAASALEVDRIVDLWPTVRVDVKALNRRVEALLSEVDPVAITGNQITLAAPYPFHRDKLNSDDVRDTVAGVLSRHLGRDVSIQCVLRGEMGSAATATAAPAAPPVAASNAEQPLSDDEERANARLRAAKNIFDAEEVAEPIVTGQPAPEESP